jgi:hypothetical protein
MWVFCHNNMSQLTTFHWSVLRLRVSVARVEGRRFGLLGTYGKATKNQKPDKTQRIFVPMTDQSFLRGSGRFPSYRTTLKASTEPARDTKAKAAPTPTSARCQILFSSSKPDPNQTGLNLIAFITGAVHTGIAKFWGFDKCCQIVSKMIPACFLDIYFLGMFNWLQRCNLLECSQDSVLDNSRF